MRIFISYRRADSQSISDRIYEWLAEAFGKENVFQDVYGIRAGDDFRDAIRQQVGTCDVLIVVIGQSWLNVTETDDGSGETRRRLENPNDSVRLEIEAGLSDRTKTLVIPVLVNEGKFPAAVGLPESMRNLANLNAAQIRNNPYFEDDMRRLIARLREHDRERPSRAANTPQRNSPVGLIVGGVAAVVLVAAIVFIASRPQGLSSADQTATANAQNLNDSNQTQTAVAQQSADATGTISAQVGYFLGGWNVASGEVSTTITGLQVSLNGNGTLTLTYTSYCPPQGNLCLTTESEYIISDATFTNGQVRGQTGNTQLTLIRGAESGQLITNVRLNQSTTDSVAMVRRRFIDDLTSISTLQINPNFVLIPTSTP